MPSKTNAAPKRRSTATKAVSRKESPIEIVVRRGAMRRFDALKTRTSELPVVVTWDRRTDDRRDAQTSAGVKRDRRRKSDRRKQPPFTWDLADFVVVEPAKRQKTAAKKPSKKS